MLALATWLTLAATMIQPASIQSPAYHHIRTCRERARSSWPRCAQDSDNPQPFRRLRQIFSWSDKHNDRIKSDSDAEVASSDHAVGASTDAMKTQVQKAPMVVESSDYTGAKEVTSTSFVSGKRELSEEKPLEKPTTNAGAKETTSPSFVAEKREVSEDKPSEKPTTNAVHERSSDATTVTYAPIEGGDEVRAEHVMESDEVVKLARLAMNERDQARRAQLALAERDALFDVKQRRADEWGQKQPAATDWIRRDAAELMWRRKEELAARGADEGSLRQQWGEEDRLSELEDGDWRLDEFERLLEKEQGWRKAVYRWWLKVWDASGDDYLFDPDETDDYGFPKTRLDGTPWDEPPRRGDYRWEALTRERRADDPKTRARLRAAEVNERYERRMNERQQTTRGEEDVTTSQGTRGKDSRNEKANEEAGGVGDESETLSARSMREREGGGVDGSRMARRWSYEYEGRAAEDEGDRYERLVERRAGRMERNTWQSDVEWEDRRRTRRRTHESRERYVKARLERLGEEVESRMVELEQLDDELAVRREQVSADIAALTADEELDAWQISAGVASQMPPSVRARQLTLRRLEQERIDLQERRLHTWDALEVTEERLVEIDYALRAMRAGGLPALRDCVDRKEVSRSLRTFVGRWL